MKNSFVSKSMTPIGGAIVPAGSPQWNEAYIRGFVNETLCTWKKLGTNIAIKIDVSSMNAGDTIKVIMSEAPSQPEFVSFTETLTELPLEELPDFVSSDVTVTGITGSWESKDIGTAPYEYEYILPEGANTVIFDVYNSQTVTGVERV
jgi:hypothetical protein